MIAVDTNILVRYFVEDDSKQAGLARAFIEERLSPEEPGLITTVAVAELSWVLERLYGQPRAAITAIVTELLQAAQFVVEQEDAVRAAISHPYEDLADALIHEVGRARGCRATMTFDKKFARLEGVVRLA